MSPEQCAKASWSNRVIWAPNLVLLLVAVPSHNSGWQGCHDQGDGMSGEVHGGFKEMAWLGRRSRMLVDVWVESKARGSVYMFLGNNSKPYQIWRTISSPS